MATCPKIVGYILVDKLNPETGDCYVGLQNLNTFVSEHEEKIQHINNKRLQDLNKQYGKPTQKILDSVQVSANFPSPSKAFPLAKFFKKLPKHHIVKMEKIFAGKKTIVTTNRKVVQELIKFGRPEPEKRKELKLSAAKNLEGINFPGNVHSIGVTTWNENIKSAKFDYEQSPGLKFENYVTGNEDSPTTGRFQLYAILYLEIGTDAIILYNAETDAVIEGPIGIETVELKLSPEVSKYNIDNKASLKTVFHSRDPSSEIIRGQMPVLQGILGNTDKLIVAYYAENFHRERGTVWKGVQKYRFHQIGHNLLEGDLKTLEFFVDKVLSIELSTRATQEDKIKWNNVLIQRGEDGNVKCLREYYWGPMSGSRNSSSVE